MLSIQEIFEKLIKELNPKIATMDSLQGVLIIFGIIGLIWAFKKRILQHVWYGFMFVIWVEIMHNIASTSIGEALPFLRVLFNYSFLQAIAQLFVGTPVATVLCAIEAFLAFCYGGAAVALRMIWGWIVKAMTFLYPDLFHAG